MKAKTTAAVNALLQRVLGELKHMSPSELKALPDYSDREEQHDGQVLMAATWKKQLSGEDTQIVVQAYRTKGFGSYMVADGFIIRSDGTFDPLPENTRLEYC